MPTYCGDLETIDKTCVSSIGGLKESIYINDSANVLFTGFELTAGVYTAIELAGDPAIPFEVIEFRKNISDFKESYTQSPTGATVWTHTLTLTLHGRDAAKSRKINLLAAGQRDLDIVFQQNDGGYVYLREAQLRTSESGTMAVKTDASNYVLTFVSESEHSAYFVAADQIPLLIP